MLNYTWSFIQLAHTHLPAEKPLTDFDSDNLSNGHFLLLGDNIYSTVITFYMYI